MSASIPYHEPSRCVASSHSKAARSALLTRFSEMPIMTLYRRWVSKGIVTPLPSKKTNAAAIAVRLFHRKTPALPNMKSVGRSYVKTGLSEHSNKRFWGGIQCLRAGVDPRSPRASQKRSIATLCIHSTCSTLRKLGSLTQQVFGADRHAGLALDSRLPGTWRLPSGDCPERPRSPAMKREPFARSSGRRVLIWSMISVVLITRSLTQAGGFCHSSASEGISILYLKRSQIEAFAICQSSLSCDVGPSQTAMPAQACNSLPSTPHCRKLL